MTTKPILKQPKTYLLVQSGYTLFTTALVRSVLGVFSKFHPSLMRSGFETKMEGAISKVSWWGFVNQFGGEGAKSIFYIQPGLAAY